MPLADIPLVRTALDLIALGALRGESGAVAAALRSPYLPDAERQWTRRAAIERDWLEKGRRNVSMIDAVVALERHSPDLASRWREGSDLRVQIKTDERYNLFVERASEYEVLGVCLPVAAIEDVLQGKVWAVQDPARRPSKRQKDLADIARLIEVRPGLRSRVPAAILDRLF